MPDNPRDTEVEVWTADVTRYEATPKGTFTTELIELHPPRLIRTIELTPGATLEFGRSPEVGHKIQISESTEVSRVALTLTEGTFVTTAKIGQLTGVSIQLWGHRGATLRDKDATVDTIARPTSYLVETTERYYWILVNPGTRTIPSQYRPDAADDDATDGSRIEIPADSPAHDVLEKFLPHLEDYYSEFLEWPPRSLPVGTKQASTTASVDKIAKVASAFSEFGLPRYAGLSRGPEILEWLVARGLITVDRSRTRRTSTISSRAAK